MKIIKLLFGRFGIVTFAILIQMAVYLLFFFMLSEYYWIIYVLSLAIAVVVFGHVINRDINPAQIILWVSVIMLSPIVGYVSLAFSLAVLIPELAVLCRRLHDTGRGSWWVALMALLIAGYYGSFATLIGNNFTELATTNPQDVMAMAQEMANSIQESPGLATVMMICSMGSILLALIMLIFTIKDSDWGENKYGPSPKYK